MRTIQLNVFKFAELSAKAKKKVLSDFYDTNVNYDWWDFIYEDAATVGIKLTGFDLSYQKTAEGALEDSAAFTCYAILTEHGEETETYKIAKEFSAILVKWKLLPDVCEDEQEDAEESFLKKLLEAYANMLYEDYEYRTSDKAIKADIEENGEQV